MNQLPEITVVICAYTTDRWHELRLAVEHSLADPVAHDTVVVIDHNEPLFAMVTAQWPQLRVVRNGGPAGLSAARNTALRFISTELVAFLDDDAFPLPGWLAALSGPFTDPRVVASGGVAEPVWPDGAAPAHLPRELWWVVGCSFTGQPISTTQVRNVMGCNMMFRLDDLRGIGGFNPDLGRVGTKPVGAEETEVCLLLQEDNPDCRIVFAPEAVVRHHVIRPRLTWAYLWRRSFGEGVSKAVLAADLPQAALSTESTYLRRVLPAAFARAVRRPSIAGMAAGGGIMVAVLAAGMGYGRAKAGILARGRSRSARATRVGVLT